MDRNAQLASANLLDREGRIVAEILERFRSLVLIATTRVSNRTNVGQAAFNSMHIDLETRGLIKSCEDLLSLTRQLRELWVVGPLRRPGEGEREAAEAIDGEVARVVDLLNGLRETSRQGLMGNHGTYVSAAGGEQARASQSQLLSQQQPTQPTQLSQQQPLEPLEVPQSSAG